MFVLDELRGRVGEVEPDETFKKEVVCNPFYLFSGLKVFLDSGLRSHEQYRDIIALHLYRLVEETNLNSYRGPTLARENLNCHFGAGR